MFRGTVRRIHFVGIGGAGMCGIAEVLLGMGFEVTGSDLRDSPAVRRLRALGGRIEIGHDAAHVAGADVVVRSTAVPADNVEVVAAEAAGVPVIPRAEMLAELMRMKHGIAVAGTHGKTTTTSMIARCLHAAGLDPTVVIGGRLDVLGSSARLGAGDLMVAEADESDGSFLLLAPTVAVVTSVDPEHLDHWGSPERLADGFAAFANRVPFYGFAALCLDHPGVQALLPRTRRKVVTYGLTAQADVRGVEVETRGTGARFQVVARGERLGAVRIGMPGRHNVQNALAAVAVGLELGVGFGRLAEALDGFAGVDRRFSIRARLPLAAGAPPVVLVDDYGHHPVEIRATLRAAAEAWPGRRVLAVFQPHRYTRVRDLLDEFARSFNDAAHVVVCPIYRAGERPIEGIDHELVARRLVEHGHRSVRRVDDLEEAAAHLAAMAAPGDVVLTLGAGDVGRVCGALEERLRGGG